MNNFLKGTSLVLSTTSFVSFSTAIVTESDKYALFGILCLAFVAVSFLARMKDD